MRRNRIVATTRQVLDSAEADYGLVRALGLVERPVQATGDMRQVQSIHHLLFQDVDEGEWELRTVDMRKGSDPATWGNSTSKAGEIR